MWFLKAKFKAVETKPGEFIKPADEKKRFHERSKALDWIGTQLDRGATSVTIRPEGEPDHD